MLWTNTTKYEFLSVHADPKTKDPRNFNLANLVFDKILLISELGVIEVQEEDRS